MGFFGGGGNSAPVIDTTQDELDAEEARKKKARDALAGEQGGAGEVLTGQTSQRQTLLGN